MEKMAKANDPKTVTLAELRSIPSINHGPEDPLGGLTPKAVKRKAVWNLFVFSLCYFLVYTGFWSLANFQSTMNAEGNIGDYTQAGIYVFSMVSSLFFPKFLIERFGCKTILIVGSLVCCLYMAANAYLRMEVLMTASVLFGLANGPFIAAQAFYIDELATRFQSVLKGNFEFVMASFFGVFLIFSESTQIWGNVIAYYVLRMDQDSQNGTVATNVMLSRNMNISNCGIHFDHSMEDGNINAPSEKVRLILIGAYVALGLLAVVVLIFFLEPLRNDRKIGSGCSSICSRFFSAIARLKKPEQLLLIPISVFIGMEGPLYTNEVTRAFIACSWGVEHVGYVTICFGVCGAVMAITVGPLVKCISQLAVLILAASADVILCALLYIWKPDPDRVIEYFLFAGVWGMSDVIWWSQISALYGLMFPDDREAAFSNLYFWSYLGFFLSYIYANYFTVPVKINIVLSFLFIGMLGYLIGQFKHKRSRRREYIASC